MAFLYKPHGTANYCICWCERGADGRRHWRRKSTGTPEYEQANELLEIFNDAQRRRLARERVDSFVRAAGCAPVVTDTTLGDLWQWYMDHCEISGADRQVRDRHNALARFIAWCAAEHPEIKRVGEVTLRVASEYWAILARNGAAPTTRNNTLSALNSVWGAVHAPMELKQNPWSAIKRDRGGSIPYQPFTPEELAGLRKSAAEFISTEAEPGFWPAAIETGYYTGLRLGDIATLDWDEIKAEDGFLILIPNKTRHWGDDRVAVHALSLPWVRMLPPQPEDGQGGYVWPCAADAYKRGHLSAEFTAIARAAGITLDREAGESERRNRAVRLKTFHSLRHTFATEMLKAGISESELRDQGNWSGTEVIHGHYNHAKLELAKKIAAKVAAMQHT